MHSTGPKISSRAIVMSLRDIGEASVDKVALGDPLRAALAADDDLRPFGDTFRDIALDAIELNLRDHGA